MHTIIDIIDTIGIAESDLINILHEEAYDSMPVAQRKKLDTILGKLNNLKWDLVSIASKHRK